MKDIEAHTATSTVSDPADIDELKTDDFEQKNVGTLDRRLKTRHVHSWPFLMRIAVFFSIHTTDISQVLLVPGSLLEVDMCYLSQDLCQPSSPV